MHDDDLKPRPVAPAHAIGQLLDALSVDELTDRILLLQAEIVRLEAARVAKRSALDAAQSFFKTN